MNPYLSQDVLEMIEAEKIRSPKDFDHIYGGDYKTILDGAIFAEELHKVNKENRLTRVPVQAGVDVHTFWDLGQSDNTAIWFVQIVGMEFRVLDYYQANGQKMPHYIEMLREKGYIYGDHCLPHDAEFEQQSAISSIKTQMQDAIRDNPKLGRAIRIVTRISKKALGIEAARVIFDQCVFDKDKTKDGLQCLRHYAYAKDLDSGKVGKQPKHDMWSHGADAFLCFAQHFKRPHTKQVKSVMI
jgi:phage terminase large subunit